MNNCKRCFRSLEQVGNLRRAAFPEGRWWDSQIVDRRYTLLQCPECKELTFLIERLDADKNTVDWHYLTSVECVKTPCSPEIEIKKAPQTSEALQTRQQPP